MTATRYFVHLKGKQERRQADLVAIVIHNLQHTLDTMQLCIANGWVYRMTSSLYPLLNHPNANQCWDDMVLNEEVDDKLFKIKHLLTRSKLRVSLHPDQFIVPASNKPDVVRKSVAELENHAQFMDMIGVEQSYNYPINIHMNCYLGQRLEDVADRFATVYGNLSKSLKSRLVLENEDKPNSWNVHQLYTHIYSRVAVPITYDCLHYKCNPGPLDAIDSVELAKSTWRQHRPLFHFSDGDSDNTNPRQHRDYPVGIPLEYYYLDNVDFDMEFTMKDYAIKRLMESYPQNLKYEASNDQPRL